MPERPAAGVPLATEFWRFSLVGALGFAVDAVVFLALNSALGWPIAAARATSTVCAITATWWLNRQLTFAHRRSQSWAAELLRYALGQAAGLGVNLGVFTVALWLLTPLRELPIVALALGSATALLFNFVTARTFAFRGRG